jgi:hypothetical protein
MFGFCGEVVVSFRLFLALVGLSAVVFGNWKAMEAKNRLVKHGETMAERW